MGNSKIQRVHTISRLHRMRGLPPPEHPLVSVVDLTTVKNFPPAEPVSLVYDFYAIFLKKKCNANFRYGQQQYDFDSGTMSLWLLTRCWALSPAMKSLETDGMDASAASGFFVEYPPGRLHQAV